MESGGALQSEMEQLTRLEQKRLSTWGSCSTKMKSGFIGSLPLKNEEIGQIFHSMQKFRKRAQKKLEK